MLCDRTTVFVGFSGAELLLLSHATSTLSVHLSRMPSCHVAVVEAQSMALIGVRKGENGERFQLR